MRAMLASDAEGNHAAAGGPVMGACSGGHQRHWFTERGHVGTPVARCVRCKAPNPRLCLAEYHDCDEAECQTLICLLSRRHKGRHAWDER